MSVERVARRLYRRPARGKRRVKCQICGLSARDGDGPIAHFQLSVGEFVPVRGMPGYFTTRQRGAGAIDLCAVCWRRATEQSRIRRGKPRARREPSEPPEPSEPGTGEPPEPSEP